MKKKTRIIIKTASKLAGKTAKKYAVKAAKDFVKSMAPEPEDGAEGRHTAANISESIVLRSMTEEDRPEVLEMMRTFFTSEAVLTDGSEDIYNNDITECVSDSPYAEGFVFESDSRILGYAIIAHSFSTEYGRHCIWIEDLYLCEEARGLGLASAFLDYIAEEYPDALHRLESEHENTRAMEVYKHKDFREMPYVEMFR